MILLGAAVQLGLASAAGSGATAAADSFTQPPVTKTVSYTSGKSGHKLKWLPYRPSNPGAADRSVTARRDVGATSPAPVKTARQRTLSPFDDPFGDNAAEPKPKALAQTLNDDLLERPKPEPAADDLLPDYPADDTPLQSDAEPKQDGAKMPSLEEALAEGRLDLRDRCLSPDQLKPIAKITNDISAEDGEFPKECPLGEKTFQARVWAPTTFTWKASGLCHKPLYFEDVHLERYGHSWGPYIQPIISGGHFFLTVPVLPYKMGLYPPQECIYTLGYYRPGSCAPYMLDPLPISVRAALFEAGAWVGGVLLIP